jgi:hypothetical protein
MLHSDAPTERNTVSRWGNWGLDPEERLLVHLPSNYRLDFKKMDTCAGMLDIIFQAEAKPFISFEDVGQLVTALADIFNPQANLCSYGRDKPFDAQKQLSAGLEDGFEHKILRPRLTLEDLTN